MRLLIIGQGLAGSVLTLYAIRGGHTVTLADPNSLSTASKMSGGVMNPITGKRLSKSWNWELFLAQAISFYRQLEEHWKLPLLEQRRLIRIIKDDKEKHILKTRLADPSYRGFITLLDDKAITHYKSYIEAPLGAFEIHPVHVLNVGTFLGYARQMFLAKGIYRETLIDYDTIKLTGKALRWDNTDFDRVIFCEGYKGQNNPWFTDLPWAPAKGEMLRVETTADLPQTILNKGKWILPETKNRFKVGATYAWDNLESGPSPLGRTQLIKAYEGILHTHKGAFTTVEALAGVRPCTRDAKPFIGFHPQYPQVGIFNGFGSKGTLMAPYYARFLLNNLYDLNNIKDDALISRYYPQSI